MNKKSTFTMDDKNDPIYYNLTLNKCFTAQDNTGFNTPANFTEINTTPILFNSGDWFVSLMRCTIPTGNIPRYIFPIQLQTGTNLDGTPIYNNDVNLSYNTFTFRYVTGLDANNNPIYQDPANLNEYQLTAQFQSEVFDPYPLGYPPYLSVPKSPAQNNGQQDINGSYYYVYNIDTLLKIFNDTLAKLWPIYINAMNSQHGTTFPANLQPFYTYNDATRLWSFYAEKTLFCQNLNPDGTFKPYIAVFIDGLTSSNTFIPYKLNARNALNKGDQSSLLIVYDYYINNIIRNINNVNYTFLIIEANQSSVSSLSAFQKIVFEISGDISLKNNETESNSVDFQGSTTSGGSGAQYQKPLISMLVDFEVDREQWATNSSFIQFQASAVEQVRLLSLSEKSAIQNFNLNIYWVDSYGNRNILEIPSIGNPLTVKLAFFNKRYRT